MTNVLTALSSISVPSLIPTAQSDSQSAEPVNVEDFNPAKQATLFKSLKQNQFSGQLILWDRQGVMTIFHLFHGRIVFAAGGHHPIRRWKRNLKLHCPGIASDLDIRGEAHSLSVTKIQDISWQYQLLYCWVKEQKINRQQVLRLMGGLLSEILFDLTQARQITYILKSDKSCSTPLILINPEDVLDELQKFWLTWQQADLAKCSPNLAPVITKPEQLEAQGLPFVDKILLECLDGEASLRDLAVELEQDILSLTRSLLLYVQWGLIEFIEINDLSGLTDTFTQVSPSGSSTKRHLVAYIDDNLEMSQRIQNLITIAGYQCVAVYNKFEAVAICLDQNPDIIVINGQMPNGDGYQICHELRRLPFFRHTPIIMLADKVSLIDKVRAKISKIARILPALSDQELIIPALFKSLAQESSI